MHIAIFCTNPPDAYSGGRYCALMNAEALLHGGHVVHFITNVKPIFYNDFSVFPHHSELNLHITKDFYGDLPEISADIVILVPGTSESSFYYKAQLFALKQNAHLVLLNFETANWFNSLSPVKRRTSNWKYWLEASKTASLILSIAKEGNTYAQQFYKNTPKYCKFDYCYPAINTFAADQVSKQNKEKRIIMMTRFIMSDHKGTNRIPDLLCESMRGYAFVLLVGPGDIPRDIFRKLHEQAQKFGVYLEFKHKLSDAEKFKEIKRSSLMLFPSLFEGYGLPPIEAQYCNIPCVVFDLPVLRETSGEGLIYAKHADWNDFKIKIENTIDSLHYELNLKDNIQAVANIQSQAKRLNHLLTQLGTRHYQLEELKKKVAPKIKKKILVGRNYRFSFKQFIKKNIAEPLLKKSLQKFKRNWSNAEVCYYPRFENSEDLTHHYFKASWYLPFVENYCEAVTLYQKYRLKHNSKAGPCPVDMGQLENCRQHIKVDFGIVSFIKKLIQSGCVLCWKNDRRDFVLKIMKLAGLKIINVDTFDPSSIEYGNYCNLIWEHLLPDWLKMDILQEHATKFRYTVGTKITQKSYNRACVFGTGPSLEDAKNFNFKDCLTVVCNTIIQSNALLEHIQPDFITAGDVVSHFGVSKYAFQFRNDLIRQLKNRDMWFITTARFGYLFITNHPEIANKTILIDQTLGGPNFDLIKMFGLPYLDSTLNIHMLPIAATFVKEIYLLGVDGKSKNRSNEDFWAHAKGIQYNDLVQTGHRCHPTFDLNRQCHTMDRFLHSISDTINKGESDNGIFYCSLRPSNINVLQERSIPSDWYDNNNNKKPYSLKDISHQFYKSPNNIELSKTHVREKSSDTLDSNLPPVIGISECSISDKNILKVRGFALTCTKDFPRIIVSANGYNLGSPLHLYQKRSDVLKTYPEYNNENSGFLFIKRINTNVQKPCTVRIELFHATNLIDAKEVIAKIL